MKRFQTRRNWNIKKEDQLARDALKLWKKLDPTAWKKGKGTK